VGPLTRFFPLHKGFFGLTASFKENLWEEIFACIKHVGMTYQDVLSAPTCERRFFLLKLIDDKRKEHEAVEERMESVNNKNAKGSRTTKVGGQQLKSKFKDGNLDLNG